MITVTVRAASVARARAIMAVLGRGAGQVELRLDDLADQEWEGLIAGSRLPVIATCRPRHEGGGFPGGEEERVEVLRRAAAAGAAAVDVELGSAAEVLLHELPPARLVLSVHDHSPGSESLEEHARRLLAAPRAVALKLAYTPRRVSDCLPGRVLLARAAGEGHRLILVPMGPAGIPGRVLAQVWGSLWSYAAPDGVPPAAPGQLPLAEMADLYDVAAIGPGTVLTGLLGWPVEASLSPWMHNRAARDAGLNARYLPFPEEDAADFLMNAPAWGLRGVSVTRPHKRTVLPWLDATTPAARACGAVNTLTFGEGRVEGDNTDAGGALAALRAVLPGDLSLDGCRISILGAGGAARAVAWALSGEGARVTLHARRLSRAQAAAADLGVAAAPLAALADCEPQVLVHATPVGSWPHAGESLLEEAAVPGRVVFDLVSFPRRTRLLAHAARGGAIIQDGVAMLVRQGEEQFRLWHGQAPPPGSFAAAAEEGIRRRGQEAVRG